MNRRLNIFQGSGNLRTRLIVHVSSLLLMAIAFGVVIVVVNGQRSVARDTESSLQSYLNLREMDFGDPVDRALLRESLGLFYPEQPARNDSLLLAIDGLRQRQFTEPGYKTGTNLQGLNWNAVRRIGGMYVQFLAVYILALTLIYVAAQRIAIYRFVKMKQHRESYGVQAIELLKQLFSGRGAGRSWMAWGRVAALVAKALVKGLLLVLLFSPAYIIAYSVKTSVDTSSLLFMVLLAIVSNGVLVHTANRFFTLLVAESHKGYVQTAIAKNLNASYEWDMPDGIPIRSLLRSRLGLTTHVFQHVFLNARFQFIPTLKEHATFLVTGLIIIEMALNIQGHLCYELLQQILYRQYDVAGFIIFSIFFTVKATDIVVDIWNQREKRRYGY